MKQKRHKGKKMPGTAPVLGLDGINFSKGWKMSRWSSECTRFNISKTPAHYGSVWESSTPKFHGSSFSLLKFSDTPTWPAISSVNFQDWDKDLPLEFGLSEIGYRQILWLIIMSWLELDMFAGFPPFLNTPIFLHLSTLAPSLKVVFQLSLRVSLTPMN